MMSWISSSDTLSMSICRGNQRRNRPLAFSTPPWSLFLGLFRSRASLEAENLALRQQIIVLQRTADCYAASAVSPNSFMPSWAALVAASLRSFTFFMAVLVAVSPKSFTLMAVRWHLAQVLQAIHGSLVAASPKTFNCSLSTCICD